MVVFWVGVGLVIWLLVRRSSNAMLPPSLPTPSAEELLRQRLHDLEGKKVLAQISGQTAHLQPFAGAMPTPPEAVKEAAKLAALSQPVDVSRLKRLGEYR